MMYHREDLGFRSVLRSERGGSDGFWGERRVERVEMTSLGSRSGVGGAFLGGVGVACWVLDYINCA
ncbi:unnamed protein product [Arabidopsis thaliana]|uniref:(thale cress) hypothetical protein n=1 Tax=Arabidopsis thaliana TaxID=3702 RepID=A0A7G2ES51_ARATH|nr:unnamed protein product [Arabidopsis thaliana]